MKKPYVKKLDQIADIAVWNVDGLYIRKNIDEEFTNFGQHYRFRFIPKNELWIDQEHGPGEQPFFIDHLLIERRLMAGGLPYDKALEKADENIHKKLFRKYSGKVTIWIVNGELVRSLYFIDFTEGGHDLVYPHFIPKNEVWLDDDLSPGERNFVLLHELHERHLMSLGWPYFRAHRSASRIEYHCRAHEEDLEKNIRLEMGKNLLIESPCAQNRRL